MDREKLPYVAFSLCRAAAQFVDEPEIDTQLNSTLSPGSTIASSHGENGHGGDVNLISDQ